jgi:hypothetical protein
MGETKISSMLAASIETIVETKFNKLMADALGGATVNGAGTATAAPAIETRAAAPKAKAEKPTGRLPRRSMEEILASAGEVANLLKKHPDGLRAEDIRMTMGWDQREVPRVLKAGVDGKLFKVVGGQKRSTTYGLGAVKARGPKTKSTKKAPRKAKKAK